MAGLKCSYCGGSIRYHGIPNGIEHTVFSKESWNKIISTMYDPKNERMHNEWPIPGPYLYRSDTIWEDFKEEYFEVWVCPHCGTLAIFDSKQIRVKAVYAPTENKPQIDKQGKMYVVFSDYIWEEITEISIPISQIPSKFKPSCVAIANEEYIWLLNSEQESENTKIYHRIAISEE